MKQRSRLRLPLLLVAVVTAGAACGILDTQEPEWDSPQTPGDPTGQGGSTTPQQVDTYSTQPGGDPGGTGATQGYGTPGYGTPGYGSQGYGAGSGSSSDPYGGTYGPYDSDSTTGGSGGGTGNTGAGLYVHGTGGSGAQTGNGSATGSTASGSTTGDTGSGTAGDTASQQDGKLQAQVVPSVFGWFVCEFGNPIGWVAGGLTAGAIFLKLIGRLSTLIKWIRNGVIALAAFDNGGCNSWLEGTVGGRKVDVANVPDKKFQVLHAVSPADLVGQEVQIKLVTESKAPFVDIEALRAKVTLGQCSGRITAAQVKDNLAKIPCSFGGDTRAIANTTRERQIAAGDVQGAARSETDSDSWWEGLLRFLQDMVSLTGDTATLELKFR